jgi:hypothetical protein
VIEADATLSPRWFDEIGACAEPWQHWLKALPQPAADPLEAIIADTIAKADAARLRLQPGTARFDEMWTRFRWHHLQLEDGTDYRKRRYLVWRAAALNVICMFGCKGVDASAAHEKLAEVMREFGPYGPDGSCGKANFWQPLMPASDDGELSATNNSKPRKSARKAPAKPQPDPLAAYAQMVLLLVRNSYGMKADGP